MRWVDALALAAALPMSDAVDAVERAFAGRLPEAPERQRILTREGELLLMAAHGDAGVGMKVLTVSPRNPERGHPLIGAVYVLFSASSQQPEAVLDGAALTAMRTAAVSALATRHLALPSAQSLVIFGAGVQANAHLEAMCAVRPVERVTIVSRTAPRAEELANVARGVGLDATAGTPQAVGEADLVCTCTTSPTPVVDGSWLRDGAHVNAVGAYTPDTRELDDETIRRGRVVVESREAALAEAGDLLIPIRAGMVGEDHVVADLSEVVHGARVRRSPEDVTVFKSVGVAFEDLVVARAAVDRLGA